VVLAECYLAGMRYHEGGAVPVVDFQLGERLRLCSEPFNPADRHAVGVRRADGLMLGYLPRWINKVPSRLLAQGVPLGATLIKVNAGEPPWHRLKVCVTLGGFD